MARPKVSTLPPKKRGKGPPSTRLAPAGMEHDAPPGLQTGRGRKRKAKA